MQDGARSLTLPPHSGQLTNIAVSLWADHDQARRTPTAHHRQLRLLVIPAANGMPNTSASQTGGTLGRRDAPAQALSAGALRHAETEPAGERSGKERKAERKGSLKLAHRWAAPPCSACSARQAACIVCSRRSRSHAAAYTSAVPVRNAELRFGRCASSDAGMGAGFLRTGAGRFRRPLARAGRSRRTPGRSRTRPAGARAPPRGAAARSAGAGW